MTENIPTMEDTAENILNEREVLNVFDKIIVGEYVEMGIRPRVSGLKPL